MNVSGDAELTVEIERILPGGMGLAHAQGQTIFVALAAPGDRVRVKIDRERGKLAFASIVEILVPASVRVDPPCPYFGRCGGCDFQQLTYESQLNAKREIILDCLHRIARIENPPEIPVFPSPRPWHYRARANWQIDSKLGRIGYYERGTHEVCNVEECAVLVPELEQALQQVRVQIKAGADANEIEAMAGDDAVSLAPALPGFATKDVTRKVGSETYHFSAAAFFQVNHDLLESLVAAALAGADGKRALDLYCGAGLFTVPLARRFAEVTGVESNAHASEYARRNLKEAGLENARVVTARVSEWLKHSAPTVEQIDFLLLDPPRTGAEPAVIEGILDLNPKRICYVSCDPATLARDLKELLKGGCRLEWIGAFDMFPQTHHVETVVHLRNRD